jgi:hypothetical protein
LAGGMYVVQIKADNSFMSKKFVVQ